MALVLKDLFVKCDFDASLACVSFTAPKEAKSVSWEILEGKKVFRKGRASMPKSGRKIAFDADMKGFRAWNTHDPFLYTLSLKVKVGSKTEVIEQSFGMRKIEAREDGLFVNNEPFYVRGHIRGREAHDHPNYLDLPLEEYYAKNIREAKEYGFNFIRFHSRIPPEECFQAADKLGMFIHVEIRKYFGKYQKERGKLFDNKDLVDNAHWRNEIQRVRNHPSIMVYCLGNEVDHPGRNPRVQELCDMCKKLDPTALFLDTCSRGEFDRTYVDFDVQHMSYYFPFGKNYTMFEDTFNWRIYGSCKGQEMVRESDKGGDNPDWRVERALSVKRPILAHEICHYVAWRDLDTLEKKFDKCGAEKPWWIGELKKLIKEKKMDRYLDKCFEASRRFQFLGWKLGIEAARRSKLLSGFHFLQFADTERYENSNGIVDCFDEKTGIDVEAFNRFNGPAVVLADLPRRTYFEKELVGVEALLSHFDVEINGPADFEFELKNEKGKAVLSGGLTGIDMSQRGRREITRVELRMPEVKKAQKFELVFRLKGTEKKFKVENGWDLWVFPDRAEEIPACKATVALDDINLTVRYPQIENKGSLRKPEKLMVVNRFTPEVFKQLEKGGDVLMLYRVAETRDRRDWDAEKEKYYLPATWDRFKGTVWDRGHNCGAFTRNSGLWKNFPQDGFLDFQFSGIVNDCDKICLDDFPVDVQPIMQGVDKAVRDRFDVYTYKLSELVPEYTMRKFAYLFELKVGKGRLLVSGFNLTGVMSGLPEACGMFEALMKYVTSKDFKPKLSISADELKKYLAAKGKAVRTKERRMTQYWQLNDAPLESKAYWAKSIDYLAKHRPHEAPQRDEWLK